MNVTRGLPRQLAWVLAAAGLLAMAVPAVASTTPLVPQRSVQAYRLPAVKLQGADGVVRPLADALDDGRPVVLTFMYSSCATVCPITNQTLVQFEQLLGAARSRVNVVSISIDPTYDTTRRLADYARRTGNSGAFYTSDPGTSEAVQRAFDAWRDGDKMNHQPVFLLRARGNGPWTRLDGLVTAQQLLDTYREVVAAAH